MTRIVTCSPGSILADLSASHSFPRPALYGLRGLLLERLGRFPTMRMAASSDRRCLLYSAIAPVKPRLPARLAARNQSSQRRAAIDAIHSPPPLTAASNDVARYQTSMNVASVTDDAASEQPSQAAAARHVGAAKSA